MKALAVLAMVIIVLGVLTEAAGTGRWLFESGTDQLIAWIFVLLAIWRLVSPRLIGDDEFRPFAVTAVFAMIMIGAAHMVEYFAEAAFPDVTLFQEDKMVLIIAFTTIAFMFLVVGAASLLRSSGADVDHLHPIAKWLIVVDALFAVMFIFPAKTPLAVGSIGVVRLYLAMAFLSALLVLGLFGQVARKIKVLRPFCAYVAAATVLTYLSLISEAFNGWCGGCISGTTSYSTENIAHFLSYVALSTFFLGFLTARRFHGGVYEDLEAERSTAGRKDSAMLDKQGRA